MGAGACTLMKAWILVAVMASIALAGCGAKDDPLTPYMVKPGETPDSCYYWQPDGEAALVLASAGYEANPGSFDAKHLAINNITPERNRVAFFECKFSDETANIVSMSGQFVDSEQATKWVLGAQAQASGYVSLACSDQVRVFVDGDVVGGIGTDSHHPAVLQALEIAFQRILQETGAKEYCPR